jgi:hypothetical protein
MKHRHHDGWESVQSHFMEYAHLRDGFREICSRLGFNAEDGFLDPGGTMENRGDTDSFKIRKEIS